MWGGGVVNVPNLWCQGPQTTKSAEQNHESAVVWTLQWLHDSFQPIVVVTLFRDTLLPRLEPKTRSRNKGVPPLAVFTSWVCKAAHVVQTTLQKAGSPWVPTLMQ